ncbi:MAG TPA: TonB-dependent receptor [Frateuria sp.]|uniref:TonB-dependent receptor n=1 Tax=Frateuria sp. TaxID=2211372 RepID=UPI002DF6D59E|nr:TonB-dependent receptor [Frateuria sp.]
MSSRNFYAGRPLRRTSLAVGLAVTLGLLNGGAMAQSNSSGAIFGQVSGQTATTVVIQNLDTGLSRTVPVDASGRYRASSLPTGRYKVALQNNGTEVGTRDNVVVSIAGATDVSFTGTVNATNLEGLTVVGSALPTIDVSSVDTRTVLTAEQLAKIPVARNAISAALLAPGVVRGDSRFGNNVIAMGGSGISENSYTINGYNITDPQSNETFFQMPFWAIDQEQVLTGGMGAEFGHSTGGVINVVGKRGGNTWKGGIVMNWAPDSLRAQRGNLYYPSNPDAQSLAIGTGPFGHGGPGITQPFGSNGKLYSYRNGNKEDQLSTSVYVSGPLIKDRLFLYAAADVTRTTRSGVGGLAAYNNDGTLTASSINAPTGANTYWDKATKWYSKIDWNITDSHILEFTGMADNDRDHTNYYQYNYQTLTQGAYRAGSDGNTKNSNKLWLGKYTGYITDDFTISALYGHTSNEQPQLTQIPDFPLVRAAATAPQFVRSAMKNLQPYGNLSNGTSNSTDGWRVDLAYKLGDHDLRAGVDRQELKTTTSSNYANQTKYGEGEGQNGGYWLYDGDPGYGTANGAIVTRILLRSGGDYKEKLNAFYLEDHWQVSDRWLAYIGLRNESFENYNSFGKVFIKQSNQWAPRLGVSWDVNGDSTTKVYANLGRYYLALPNGVAVRGAGGSLYTMEDYSFTGIDPTTNLPIGRVSLGPPSSSNAEFGQEREARTARINNLKSHYQDELILGFDQQLTTGWTVGARGILRRLESQVDDTSDPRPVCRFMAANNLFDGQYSSVADCVANIPYPGVIFNPGKGADFYTAPYYDADGINPDTSRLIHVTLSAADLGMPKPKRKYTQFNAYLQHSFDGKWFGRLDYTWSHSYGNTEGQIKSDIAQGDVAASQDWDFPEFMQFANGNLPNDRRHQIRALGYYQLNSEWMVSATAQANSGRPKNCIGPWFADPTTGLYTDPDGYMGRAGSNGAFHVCYGKASPRGELGNLPWTYTLDLGVQYSPNFAKNQLTFGANVFNVFDQQRPITINETSVGGAVNARSGGQPNNLYQATLQTSPGRYFRLSASYEFSL